MKKEMKELHATVERLSQHRKDILRDLAETREKLEKSDGLLTAALSGQAKLKADHDAYVASLQRLNTESETKLRKEITDLKTALNEIMPVLRRLLDWRISHPLV